MLSAGLLQGTGAHAGGTACGSPCAGNCFAVTGTPGCDDQGCCGTVCGQLPFCCVNAWDEACVAVAEELCAGAPCDCNFNGVPDDQDIAGGTSDDVNGNEVPDECEPGPDCNGNGVPDVCDIDPDDPDGDGQVSADVNGNGIPDPCEDCNGNDVFDELDIDPADPDGDGLVSFDCDADGVPDECAVLCDVDVVFVLDTSGSMAGELPDVCSDMIDAAVAAVAGVIQGQITATVLGIAEDPIACAAGTVIESLGNHVPGMPGSCCTPICASGEMCRENWAAATAIIAERFAWRPQALRVIVPMSDEGPCEGGSCEDPGSDRDALDNAIDVANEHRVTVFPVTGAGSIPCVLGLADELGNGTGGRAWHRQSGQTWAEIGAELADEITPRSEVACSVCDGDGDGVPNACDCPWDIDCDGTVGIADFLGLLAAWGLDPGGPPDFDGSGNVGIDDFLTLLAHWGPCP